MAYRADVFEATDGTRFVGVVYRHNRVLHAILLVGAALIVNMSATLTNLFGHLLLFVIAALLLWLRAALVERQDGWQRRRVNENLEVPASNMRSGVIFGAVSVLLAWVLTTVAVAAPLTDAWRSFDGLWIERGWPNMSPRHVPFAGITLYFSEG
jgi:hypothetical protein